MRAPAMHQRVSDRPDRDRVGLFSACLPAWDVEKVIGAAVSLGFLAVEWGSGPGHAIDRLEMGAEVRQLCDRAGLISSGLAVQDPEVTFATPDRAARHVDLAVALGAPYVRVFAPRYVGGSLPREQGRARAGLDALVEIAAPAGVAILVETSPGTLAPSPDLAAALVEQHPSEIAGVLYDPGNMAIEGHISPALAIARLGSHLRHVHVKNIVWSHQGGDWSWRHAPLARGMLDWRAILGPLACAGYDGQFSIDHLGGESTQARLEAEAVLLRELVDEAYAPPGQPEPAVHAVPQERRDLP
jgi:sugar phosphate isomerase/epimerase